MGESHKQAFLHLHQKKSEIDISYKWPEITQIQSYLWLNII